jgi:predicted CXXCH cytochrome family protein
MCARCHESQHKITHPLGDDVIDVRNGEPVTCISCHSMHSAKADYMLTHEKDRAICIQCHKM